MITAYNEYINRLLTMSRIFRDNPSSANKFTSEELQLVHKAAEAFEEIVYNLRIGMINERLGSRDADKIKLITVLERGDKISQ